MFNVDIVDVIGVGDVFIVGMIVVFGWGYWFIEVFLIGIWVVVFIFVSIGVFLDDFDWDIISQN